MVAHKIDKTRWPHHLAPQLTGRAQLAFAALPTANSDDYEAIKTAVLTRYDINEEAYRRRFRTTTRMEGETNRELAVRMMDLQTKWLKECSTVEEVHEVVGIEQFLNTLKPEKRLWVMERKPKTCVKAGELADEYELARQHEPRQERIEFKRTAQDQRKCHFCGKLGHLERDCRKKKSAPGTNGAMVCFNCKKSGHPARNFPEKDALHCGDQKKPEVYRSGLVEGKKVNKILLDTGCSRTMIHKSWVPPHKLKEGDAVTIRCAHGDTVLYPLADVNMEVDGLPITVEAAVSDTLQAAVLLGTDVPQLTELLGGQSKESKLEDVLVVTTRARARQQLEEEILRREKEVRTGAKPNPAVDSERAGSEQEGSSEVFPTLSKEQRRAIRQQYHTTPESTPDILDITADELREIQNKDPTLTKVREAADGKLSAAGVGFFKREGIIYRKWIPPGRGDEAAIEQLVLPTRCRQTVLELAHDVPIAGHLGKEKTRQRVLRRFYWPTVFKDIENFCQSCVTCQKATHRGVRRAPLIPLPVISVPFSRIAMDIVGPLPRS